MRRARCTLRALAAQADLDTLMFRFPRIVDALTNSTTTNMPLIYLPDLMEALASLDAEDIATVVFAEAYGTEQLIEPGGYIKTVVDPELVQAEVRRVLAAVEEGAPPGESLASECG
jgi:anionic cell wall polymer biosynthesis LytR-Cps2A-Psr (LCP) family protein